MLYSGMTMHHNSLTSIVNGLYVLGGIFGIGAAYFKLLNEWIDSEKKALFKHHYKLVWLTIEKAGFKKLPQLIVRSLRRLNVFNSYDTYDKLDILMTRTTVHKLLFVLFSFAMLYHQFGLTLIIQVGTLLLVLILICRGVFDGESTFSPLARIFITIALLVFIASIVFITLAPIYVFLDILFKLNIDVPIIFFGLLILTPFITPYLMFNFSSLKFITDSGPSNGKSPGLMFLSLALTISFFITSGALVLGHLLEPMAIIPKTPQLFMVNVVSDGLTIFFTIFFLETSIQRRKTSNLLLAILINILTASLLACGSLYFGLINTVNEVSFRETLSTLVAHTPSFKKWEIGPYFWVMHTTFIPSLIYMFLIIFAIVGKYITLPVSRFFRKGALHDKPLDLTSFTLTFLSVSILAIAKVLEVYSK